MFELTGVAGTGGPSLLERRLGAALFDDGRYLVDLVRPELVWGREWLVEDSSHRHVAARPDAPSELRRVLDAGLDQLHRARDASRDIARQSAVLATALAGFARCRPSALLDRQPGERGAMSEASRASRPAALTEVSEWAVDEVALMLGISATAANAQLEESLMLSERLPGTLARLSRGELTPAHARQMVAVVGPVEDDDLRADIEQHVLGLLKNKTPPQLGDCARPILLRKDAAAAARRLVSAVRERGVRLHVRRDGTGTVALELPLPAAAAIYRTLEACAEQARADGDERTEQQLMADCVQDLVLRPGEHGMPPVTIALTLIATLETMLGGAEPGQIEGHLVPAEMVRELGYAFGLMPRPAPQLDDLPDDGGSTAASAAAAGRGAAEAVDEPAAEPPLAPFSSAGTESALGAAPESVPTPRSQAAPPAEPVPAPSSTTGAPPTDSPSPTGSPAPADRTPPASSPTTTDPTSPAGSPPLADRTPPARSPTTTDPTSPAGSPPPAEERTPAGWMALAADRHGAALRDGLAGARQAVLDGVWTDGELRSVLDLGALMGVRDLTGTWLAHRPHIAVVDQVRGSLVALTDATAVCRGEALGPPPATDGYAPGAALDRFVRLRDRRCRFPGCRARARTCDLDHRREWPDGPTSHRNLCCLCEHHHRLKHQAPGWRVDEAPDGGLAVTTAGGDVLDSHPPRFGSDLDVPPY